MVPGHMYSMCHADASAPWGYTCGLIPCKQALQATDSQVKGQHMGSMIRGCEDTSQEQRSLTVNEQKDTPRMDGAGDRRWWQDEAA